MSLSQVTERQAGSPRSSRQPQGKQSAPPPHLHHHLSIKSPKLHPPSLHPPYAQENEETGGGSLCPLRDRFNLPDPLSPRSPTYEHSPPCDPWLSDSGGATSAAAEVTHRSDRGSPPTHFHSPSGGAPRQLVKGEISSETGPWVHLDSPAECGSDKKRCSMSRLCTLQKTLVQLFSLEKLAVNITSVTLRQGLTEGAAGRGPTAAWNSLPPGSSKEKSPSSASENDQLSFRSSANTPSDEGIRNWAIAPRVIGIPQVIPF
ncbi:hypothetical protein EYF80_034662 [Liparis tanakae]|uniref:Uncharacterized protein n=1 Tax=Liparis tanakae TaxID=230148 RepID=A0A4Z2GND1_9TELE|nr:hypothetical protein EYF80_034662 [Liparis tanakae]